MELIRGIHNLRDGHRSCVATVGNFDGVHLGHQAVLEQLREAAERHGLPTVVVVFEPTPQEFFLKAKAPGRLTRFREKCEALAEADVDRMLCVRFDERFARLSPDQFIEELLVRGLGIRYLVVGDDFRFGFQREGDFGTLVEAGRQCGFDVAGTHTFVLDGQRVSSSRIRECLLSGDVQTANCLLGRPYRMSGRVMPGQRLGRELGFPTANIRPGRRVLPLSGVFAVQVEGVDHVYRDAVASLGWRPTVAGTEALLEVHVFDFDGDIYGRHVHVDFYAKLRDEERFESLDALREQLYHDAGTARRLLAELSAGRGE